MGLESYILHASQTFWILGYILFFAIIYAESGLFFGFFLPGDSLIFTIGLLASQGFLDVKMLIVVGCLAAVSGDSTGYLFGKTVGQKLFLKENGRLFKKEYLIRAHEFYEQYGSKTIVLARFIPIVRTFAPIVAGIANMRYRVFLFFNVIGGVLWITAMLLLGYFLGRVIPNIDRYVSLITAAIIVVSILPPLLHLNKARRASKE